MRISFIFILAFGFLPQESSLNASELPFWFKNIAGNNSGGRVQEVLKTAAIKTLQCEKQNQGYDVGECVRESEAHCLNDYPEPDEQIQCYEIYNYWWYYQSYPDYSELYSQIESNRIRKEQLKIDPTQLSLLYDLALQVYSIEVRNVVKKKAETISAEAIRVMNQYEEPNQDNLIYYFSALFISSNILRHSYTRENERKIAIREFHTYLQKANNLWDKTDPSKLDPRRVDMINRSLKGFESTAEAYPLSEE